ncbi:MAG: type II toxin-antitoxin system VapB family antitoxin [Nitrospirota bacterium]
MGDTIIRLSVTLDRDTLDEAMRLTGSRTKRETIARALDELVRAERRRTLADAVGTGVFGLTERQLRRMRSRTHARV